MKREPWHKRRIAWLGFLIGRGYTARSIAADAVINTTPENVWRKASDLGLSLTAVPQGQICARLPHATVAALDRAAASANLQRDAFVERLLIRVMNEPERFLVVNETPSPPTACRS